ncbi:fibronectin type III domain-containing protein [Qaidamihabitans albus]|uniref:fibronectin type III domain-containing protein n=1 Tax=Qaidamihabitans albus TaxID=2795733 RepID=UPI0027DBD63E|nr:fibronectin type III domain-containing protein [Qaidamihabitans albus]
MTGSKLRRRLPVALLVAATAATVAIAVPGAAEPPRGLDFAQAGHWVASPDLDVVFHVNGGAKTVDAQARMMIDPGELVYQGDTSAYVVGDSRIREFGKSTLEVERTITPPTGERPVGIEAAGGPYLVYREAGTVVRLGEQPTTIRTGQGLGNPVATPDGTLWLHRRASGVLCKLAKGSDQVSCPAVTPRGHSGELTVVDEQPVFVDTTTDTVHAVLDEDLGEPVNIGLDVPGTAEIGTADAGGRIPILDPGKQELHLVDARGVATAAPSAAPLTVDLPDGDYARPEPSGDSVVLLDLESNSVRTYTNDGKQQGVTPVPAETGEPRLTRGEDARVYVDGDKGRHVMVIDEGGGTSQIPLVGEERADSESRPQPPPPERPGNKQRDRQQENTPSPPPTQPDQQVVAEQPPTRPEPPPPPPPEPPPPTRPDARPSPTPEPQPKPLPASPPGAATNVAATHETGGDTARITWGAASPNGAPVTAYHVSWRPVTGAGSQTMPGNASTAVLSGLSKGVTYTVTVVAENRAGRGPAANTTVVIPNQALTISRGDPSEYDGCGPPCHKIHVEATGLEPNTMYEFDVDSNHPTWENPGSGWETDENGNAVFENIDFGEPGYEVWVYISELNLVSNRYVWPRG